MKDWKSHKPPILKYKGKYIDNWFSNMVESPFKPYSDSQITYNTVEHFYQAMKTDNSLEHVLISKSETPYIAKKMGKSVQNPFSYLINNVNPLTGKQINTIEDAKLCVMKMGLWCKFSQIEQWKQKLLDTGDSIIIEWNNWGDKFWGVDINDCKGHNNLGILLMEVREELKNK